MPRRKRDKPAEPAKDIVPTRPRGTPEPDDRAWSSRRNVPERAARTDLVPYMALPAETGPTFAPDQLSIWPVEGGRFGIDARYHGASGAARAAQQKARLERVNVYATRARRRGRRRDAAARPARPPGRVGGDRGVPRPPAREPRP